MRSGGKCEPARGDKHLAAFGFSSAFWHHGGMVSDSLRVPWADAMLVRALAGVDPLALASDKLPGGFRTDAPRALLERATKLVLRRAPLGLAKRETPS